MAWYPKIITIKKDGTIGSVYPFPTGRCSVGGSTECDIRIRGGQPSHCLFLVDKYKQARVVNVGGTTDVQHNGRAVDDLCLISHGDIFQIGSRQFRFDWEQKRKKGERSSGVAPASHKPEGDERESSSLQNEANNEPQPARQPSGTPTSTTCSFDQSLFKTPRIPPEMFVSPLSASYSGQEYIPGEDGPRSDALDNSQLISSSSSTPLIDEPRIRALHSSTSSTPLLDAPRAQTARSRSSLAGIANSPLEQEQPVFQERQSGSSLKKRSQSCHATAEERSSKLRRSDSCGPARCTSLAYHSNANGQSGPSTCSSSGEDCSAHIEARTRRGTTAHFFSASTPVTRTVKSSCVRSNKALKGVSFLQQEKSGFATPGPQSYPNGNATTDESFLDSPGLSRRALRSSQPSLSSASLTASPDSLGLESFFKTPNSSGSVSKKELGSFMTHNMSNSSFETKHAHKRLSQVVNEGSLQNQVKRITASSVSSRSGHSMAKNTNGARTSSDQCTKSTEAMSALGQSSYTTGVRAVAAAAETIDLREGSNSGDHSGASISIVSTLSFNESARPGSTPAGVSIKAARSSIANSAVASLTCNELCFEGVSQDLIVTTDDSKTSTRSTRSSHTPNCAPASNKEIKKSESPGQEGAVAPEKGKREEGIPEQAVRDMSQSDQKLLEHMGVMRGSPKTTVSKRPSHTSAFKKVYIEPLGKEMVGKQSPETPKIEQTMQCSSQILESNPNSALEKSTLPTRSGRSGHTPTSKKMEEAPDFETVNVPSPSKATRAKRTLPSRNAIEEPNHTTVSTLSPGHMNLENVDVAVKGSVRITRSARFSGNVSTQANEKVSEHEAGGTSATLKSSGVKEAAISNKKTEGVSKQRRFRNPRSLLAFAVRQWRSRLHGENEEEVASTSTPKNVSLQNMGVAHEESSRSSISPVKHTSLEDVGVTPEKSFADTGSTRLSCTPSKYAKAGTARQKTVDMPTSKILSEEEKAPEQLVSEHMLVNCMDLAVGESPGRITRSSPVSLSKKLSASPLEHETMGPRNPFKPERVKQVQLSQYVMEQTSGHQIVDTPKSLKASAHFSKTMKGDENCQGPETGSSPSRQMSSIDMRIVVEESVKATRSSSTPISRSMVIGTPGPAEVDLQNPMRGSEMKQVPVLRKSKAVALQNLNTPQSSKVSGGRRTPASSKLNVSKEVSEEDIVGSSSAEHAPLMSTTSVMNESFRSARSSQTPVSEKLNKEALEQNTEASRTRKSIPAKVKTPLQQMVNTPKSLKTSTAKQMSASVKTTEGTPNPSGVAGAKQITPGNVTNGASQQQMEETPQSLKASTAKRTPTSIVTPNPLGSTSAKQAASGEVNNRTPQQMAGTPKSLKALAAKQTTTSSKVIEEQEDLKQATRAPAPKRVSFDNTHAVTEGLVRSTRSSLSSASGNVNIETPGLEGVGSQDPTRGSGVSKKCKELDTPKSLKTSGVKQTPASGTTSANETTTEQDVIGTPFELLPLASISPVVVETAGTRSTRSSRTSASEKSNKGCLRDKTVGLTPSLSKATGPKKAVPGKIKKEIPQQCETVDTLNSVEASTAKQPSTSKNAVEEDIKQRTDDLLSKQVSSNDICIVTEESLRATRSSQTPASRNVASGTPGLEELPLDKFMGGSGAKRPTVSRKNKKTPSQKPMDTQKSSKGSGAKQVQASNMVIADGETLQQYAVETASDDFVTSHSTDSAMDTSGRTRSIKANCTSSYEGEINVKEKREATKGTNQKPSRAKRTQTSKTAPAVEEAAERENVGVLSSEHMAFDNPNVTVAASGRAATAAGQGLEGTVSPLKALGIAQALTLASNKDLGESRDLEAVDAKSSRKVLRAKTTRSTRKVDDEEEVIELKATGRLASKCSSPATVYALAEKPARPIRNARGCHTRGSRKDNIEAPEESTSNHPQSVKATRAKRMQGSRKVCKEDEASQDIAGSSLVMSSTSLCKDATPDKELQVEVSPSREVTTTKKTRGKRKLDLKQEAITEEPSTAEEVTGIVAVKRGRRQDRVAFVKDASQESDAQHSNTGQAIYPENTRSNRAAVSTKKAQKGKAVVDNALASPNIDRPPAEQSSSGDKALAATSEPKRSKRKVAAVKVDTAQIATEEAPRKTRGRRAKALGTVVDNDKHGMSQEGANEQSEKVSPPKRTRKKM